MSLFRKPVIGAAYPFGDQQQHLRGDCKPVGAIPQEALRAIHTARALDMQIMIGCMVESSLGVSAAAHIAPLCDYADLDGPLLIRNDPFNGIHYDEAKIIISEEPGLGVQLVS